MGDFSPVHWLIYMLLFNLPVAVVLKKAGFHWAWRVLCILPLVPLIFLWVLAATTWPISQKVEANQ